MRQFITVAAVVCLILAGCGETEKPDTSSTPATEQTIDITWPAPLIDMQYVEATIGDLAVEVARDKGQPEAASVDDSGLFARVRFYKDDGGSAHDDRVEWVIEQIYGYEDKNLFKNVTKNDDGTLTVSMTEDEYTKSVLLLHDRLDEAVKTCQDAYPFTIEYEKDLAEVRFYAGEWTSAIDETLPLWASIYHIVSNAVALRLYETRDAGQAAVSIRIFDNDTGRLLGEAVMPGGELVLPLVFAQNR